MDKKYIDCEAFKRKMIDEKNFFPTAVAAALKEMPAADVVEVVRCKDCKHWQYIIGEKTEYYECRIFCGAYERGYTTVANDFCSYGERR
jgi:hypothetical protein